MADPASSTNTRAGNKVYVGETGLVTDQRVMICSILFTPQAANDSMTLRETADGPDLLFIRGATAKNTVQFDFSQKPLVFNNGIYVSAIGTQCTALLVIAEAGSK